MSTAKTSKRLVACFGTIQLITALSVLSHREQEQQQNLQYENYLVITPLFAPAGQDRDFATFIEKMARLVCAWEKIVYLPLERIKAIADSIQTDGIAATANSVYELLGVENPDEIYLSRNWNLENQILLNVYATAEKICYGDGIGIYFSHSAFLPPSSFKNSYGQLNILYKSLKKKVRSLIPRKKVFRHQEFDIGYFSLPYAFGELPPMRTIVLDRAVYLKTFQKFSKNLDKLIDFDYINNLRQQIKTAPTSILLSTNFSEAGRMSLENEIAACREFLQLQKIPPNSILLIKPHPRDSKQKILQMQSAFSDLYAKVLLLAEDFLFYLPFELLFLEVFLNSNTPQLDHPRIFTFSSACLTLEFLFDIQCTVGYGSDLVQKFCYQDHISSRIKHEADLLSTIQRIRELSAA